MSAFRAVSLLPAQGSRGFAATISSIFPAHLARQYGGVRRISYGPGPQTVFSADFWRNLIPKPLRSTKFRQTKPKAKDWNPATFYIVIFLFIGSMSIQMIAMRRNFDNFIRHSDVRIGLLREVVEKLQKGENVDVERALGAGDQQKEQDWDEVLREIEESTPKAKSKRQKKQTSTETPVLEADGTGAEPKEKKPPSAEFY